MQINVQVLQQQVKLEAKSIQLCNILFHRKKAQVNKNAFLSFIHAKVTKDKRIKMNEKRKRSQS